MNYNFISVNSIEEVFTFLWNSIATWKPALTLKGNLSSFNVDFWTRMLNMVCFPFLFVDEVDILGYGSSPSDTDESCGSDGYSVDSKRLVLNSSPFSESLWKRVKSACMIEMEMEDFFFSIYIQKLCMCV